MTLREIAECLHAHKSGNGYRAACPAHQGKNPTSLSLKEENGKILVHCFTGCDQASVIAALKDRNLWPRLEKLPYQTWIHVRQLEHFIAEIDREKERLLNSDTCLAMILDEYREWTDSDWQIWIDLCTAQKAARAELKKLLA